MKNTPGGPIREHFARDGKPKHAYPTRDEAVSGAETLLAKYGILYNPYRCQHCRLWHVGKRPRKQNRRDLVKGKFPDTFY